MWEDIQNRAVTTIAGSSSSYSHPSILVEQEPLIPGIVLDDGVVVHFCCGDNMGGVKQQDFGMVQFSEYKKLIDRENRYIIGILTQPFDNGWNCQDKGKV
jgi:hypothetical protein